MKKNRRTLREQRNQSIWRARQGQLRALLVRLGLWDELTSLGLKDVLLKAYNPNIELSISDCFPADERVGRLFDEVVTATQTATFNCPLLGEDYLIADYLTYVHPLAKTLMRICRREVKRELRQKLERIDLLAHKDTIFSAINEMHYRHYHLAFAHYMRIDGHIYFPHWTASQTAHGRVQHRVVLKRVEPERRLVNKSGEGRTAYRCGIPVLNEVAWTEWPSSFLGLSNDVKAFPVFVQRHVLERLNDRGGAVFYGEGLDAGIQYHLALSLSEPVIHRRDDGRFLVEYHLGKYKVGYLVVHKVDDLMLVETFLFLTMDGTPEGFALKRRWKLERNGKEFTGLDCLATFLCTDLAIDHGLVEIFTKCGCGHLFEMRNELGIRNIRTGYAADIRKYLKLKPVEILAGIDDG